MLVPLFRTVPDSPDPGHGIADQGRQSPCLVEVIPNRGAHQLRSRWRQTRVRRIGHWLPGRIYSASKQIRRGDTVGERMMHLGDKGDSAAFEAVDVVHLP